MAFQSGLLRDGFKTCGIYVSVVKDAFVLNMSFLTSEIPFSGYKGLGEECGGQTYK